MGGATEARHADHPLEPSSVDVPPVARYGPTAVEHLGRTDIPLDQPRRAVSPRTANRARPFHRRILRPSATIALGVAAFCGGTGCHAPRSAFEIVNHRASGEVEHFHEVFDEAYYNRDAHGNVNVVLRRSTPGEADPNQTITQVLHLRSFWRPIPGRTVTDRTQLNGLVRYHVITGQVGATFEGAGSMFFKHNPRKKILRGSVELAKLRPTRQLAAGHPIFQRAELSGTFTARYDPRRVIGIINEMNRIFGENR